ARPQAEIVEITVIAARHPLSPTIALLSILQKGVTWKQAAALSPRTS
ncbi:hypothetical protein A2U01_0105447, partial [Trifolium medium]|nr:hypothetical protein [Trifolium medium]